MKYYQIFALAASASALKQYTRDTVNSAKKAIEDNHNRCSEDDTGLLCGLCTEEQAENDPTCKIRVKDDSVPVPRNSCEGDNCQTGNLDFEALFGYGCWCFFGRIDSALGRGPPIDAYDATCQKMALCYRCIFVDAENDGEDCDPFTTEFQASLSMNALLGGGAASNATTQCVTENQSACQWRTCSCAMTMITSFFNLSFDSSANYDDNLKHSNGFDYNLECPQQGRAQDRQCCGFYPDRRTYDRHDARDCCHDISIYNPLRHVCCPDGSHIGIGHNC